jgi:hypothetical protein
MGAGKIAGDKAAQNAVNAMRVAREGAKSVLRPAMAVGEAGLYSLAAAVSVTD